MNNTEQLMEEIRRAIIEARYLKFVRNDDDGYYDSTTTTTTDKHHCRTFGPPSSTRPGKLSPTSRDEFVIPEDTRGS